MTTVHSGVLCPLCDNCIEGWQIWKTSIVDGVPVLVHDMCLEEEIH